MYMSNNGLGDADYREIAAIAEKIDTMAVGDEIRITGKMIETNQLFETVLYALKVAGFKNVLNCVRYRWFLNENDNRNFVGVFYKEENQVLLKRSKDYDK